MEISAKANSWLTLLANVGILVGLVLLTIELKQNTDQLRLQLVFETNQKIFANNQVLLDKDVATVFTKAMSNPEDLTFAEFLIADSIIINMVNEWEDRFFIYKAGLISEQDWKRHVDENVAWTLGSRYARARWDDLKIPFEREFSDYVDRALANTDDNYSYYDEWLDSGFAKQQPQDN